MKNYLFYISLLLFTNMAAEAQIINPKVKTKRAAENRVNRRVDQGIDKGLDKVEEGIGRIFKKKAKSKKDSDPGQDENTNEVTGAENGNNSEIEASKPGESISFLDFVPGSNVIFADNFEQDAIMDFPAKWNSTGSGKVVTISGAPGRWLEIAHNTYVNPVMDEALPENCTIEFDLLLQTSGKRRTPSIFFGFTEVKDIVKQNIYYKTKFYTHIGRYAEAHGRQVDYGTQFPPLGNKNDFPLLKYNNRILRVSIAANKERVRVYLDQTKIVDLPRILASKLLNNFYFQNGEVIPASEIPMYIGNVRIASADVDARSLLVKQLMEDGRAVTNDILFDVNSDVIKPTSYSIIKQLGDAMAANPSLKVKIIGHTDSDGADVANLTLSRKRAAAVKNYIVEKHGIAGARIQTDGKGETEPVAANNTNDGKAKNRRVEFVKL